ncbi:MAG: indole-3-glycerol phosphate synthase TrpC [Deltaproteobacteria bacterium]|nr:indole-3-glycerol phosphate synthase TrpC [Deltaproteobacteria bacterium]
MILDRIVEVKRREVAERKEKTPLAVLEKRIAGLPQARDFEAALAPGAIIAEVKRRSPSRGVLRADLDPAGIARVYAAHGAAAISVLTDGAFFGGSEADLAAVRDAVTLPVLRKEFIIDPWQLHETRAIGADALLLIAAILTEEELSGYRKAAESLGMAVLVEVHDGTELDKALAAGAEIVGINNRDLRTFTTDIETARALAPRIPRDRIAVAESGIRTRQEIEILQEAGVRAFLIGETLVTSPDIAGKLAELLGR